MHFSQSFGLFVAAASSASALLVPAWAETPRSEITVQVTGVAGDAGEIGCALYPSGSRFPMEGGSVQQIWMRASAAGVTCHFKQVPEGTWAVSVAHDLNGNHQVDKNFLGIPTEPWGVSNNARPSLRAPRFEEAAFQVAGQPVALTVKVAK